MNKLQIPLSQIKSAGDWQSMCVLKYLISDLDDKKDIDKIVVVCHVSKTLNWCRHLCVFFVLFLFPFFFLLMFVLVRGLGTVALTC